MKPLVQPLGPLGSALLARARLATRRNRSVLESERQFHLLTEGVTDYAIYMLDPDGAIVSWNAGAQRIKGYAANEIVGQHFACFFTDQERAAELPAQILKAARDAGRFEGEGVRVRKD